MKVRTLKKVLYEICCEGYAQRIPLFCNEEGDSYTINHVYEDVDNHVCIQSTDIEGDGIYKFTVAHLLHRLKHYNPDSYIYFLHNFEDGDAYHCDISYNWYIDYDEFGKEPLYINCFGIDD